MKVIYKIESKTVWQAAKEKSIYQGSEADTTDGFIHFSTFEQLEGTLKKHYSSKTDLLLLAFDAHQLGPQLKWEPARNGAHFPHLYGPLPTTVCLWEKPIIDLPSGGHRLPEDGQTKTT